MFKTRGLVQQANAGLYYYSHSHFDFRCYMKVKRSFRVDEEPLPDMKGVLERP